VRNRLLRFCLRTAIKRKKYITIIQKPDVPCGSCSLVFLFVFVCVEALFCFKFRESNCSCKSFRCGSLIAKFLMYGLPLTFCNACALAMPEHHPEELKHKTQKQLPNSDLKQKPSRPAEGPPCCSCHQPSSFSILLHHWQLPWLGPPGRCTHCGRRGKRKAKKTKRQRDHAIQEAARRPRKDTNENEK
jgi:hypothetical protein